MPNPRRHFLKSSLLLPAAGLSTAAPAPEVDPVYTRLGEEGHSGLLFSQIGYLPDQPVRILLRTPTETSSRSTRDRAKMTCRLLPKDDEKQHREIFTYWGEQWNAHWWIATFELPTGEWVVEAERDGETIFREEGLRVADDVLWQQSYYWATVDMLRKRSYFTKVGSGWQDAGALWAESPAQSAMLICLTDVTTTRRAEVTEEYLEKLYTQIVVGADYLVLTEQRATELGHPPGAMCHDVLGHEEYILPNDIVKATVALYRAAAVLPDDYVGKRTDYLATADRSLDYLLTEARPIGDQGMARSQRGLPDDTPIPTDEWPTRDLNFLCWAILEKYRTGATEYLDTAKDFARQLMDRQIGKDEPEAGYYGHFYEYASTTHSQKSWTHTILPTGEKRFGTDIGALFPNYLVPLCELLTDFPGDRDAPRWRATLTDFTEGYLLPACRKNPFYLVPLGIFGEHGPVWFTGPFHGTNAIYGYTAALACRLHRLLGTEGLREVAMGNLQWIAGLNAGITAENIAKGCVIYSADVPEGIALPASMVCRVGRRWAGTWFQTRGVVCNGFSVGEQFKLDSFPGRETDAPSSFTDEDWIPHSAGFLTGLMQWKDTFGA